MSLKKLGYLTILINLITTLSVMFLIIWGSNVVSNEYAIANLLENVNISIKNSVIYHLRAQHVQFDKRQASTLTDNKQQFLQALEQIPSILDSTKQRMVKLEDRVSISKVSDDIQQYKANILAMLSSTTMQQREMHLQQAQIFENRAMGQLDILKDKVLQFAIESSDIFIIKIAVFSILSILITLFSSSLLMRYVFNTVGGEPEKISQRVKSIANGNLLTTTHLTTILKNNSIYASIIYLQDKLADILCSTVNASEEVTSSSQNLSDLMRSTAEKSRNSLDKLSEILPCVEDIATNSNTIAKYTEQMTGETHTMSQHVQTGQALIEQNVQMSEQINRLVTNTAELIQDLKAQTYEVSNVVQVIGSISEQINLLALNAAIEAARAGEQGRGFSVVADEVRTLATKTHQSTQEIQQTITTLLEKSQLADNNMAENLSVVESSATLSQQIKSPMQAILSAIEKINGLSTVIVDVAQEQFNASKQIIKDTNMANQYSAENVANTEKNQQISKSLAQMAELQRQALSYFKTS